MPTNIIIHSEYSEINDDTSPSRQTKECLHFSKKMDRVAFDSYDETSIGGDRYVVDGINAHWWSWGPYGSIDFFNLAAVYDTSVSSLKAQAMHAFQNRNQVDNLLNIIESDQLIGSVSSLGELIRRMRRGGSSTSALQMLSSSGKFRRDIQRLDRVKGLDISNLYLMWQFGFAPLISDMEKMTRAVKSLKTELQRAIHDADKPYTATAKCSGTLSITGLGPVQGYSHDSNPIDSTYWHDRILYLKRPQRLVGVRGKNTTHYNSEVFKTLSYFIDRFLSNGPASLIWERIPYSFVVDWFVNLSGVVDYLDNLLKGGPREIVDVWSTESFHVLVNAVKHRTSSWISSVDGEPTVNNELKLYHRIPLDNGFSIVPSGRFGKKQALLSAALLHQLVASLKGQSPL